MRETTLLNALSLVAQSDYNTGVTPDDDPKNFEQIIQEGFSFADFVTNISDNAGFSTGTPYPTETSIESHDATKTFSERMSSERMGRRAFGAFGDYTPTALSGASAGAFKHLFKPTNPHVSDTLPVFTWAEKAGEHALSQDDGENRKLLSMFFERFSLAGDGNGFVMGESGLHGSGKIVQPSGVKFFGSGRHVVNEEDFATLLPNHFFRNTAAVLDLYPQGAFGGSVQHVACDYRSFRFALMNNPNLDDGYLGCAKFQTPNDPDSGAVRGRMRVGTQSTETEYVILMSPSMANTFNPTGKQKLQTVFSSKLIMLGGAIPSTDQGHKASLLFERQTVQATQIDSIGGDFAYRITPPALGKGQSMPVTLEIISDVEEYGVLA